jgi:hypothetical protein
MYRPLCLLVTFVIILSPSVNSQGDLLINPKRIVFEGNKRSEEINLANTGKDSATFVISFNQVRMTETGNFESIIRPDSGQNFADKNIRVFPRRVTLAPNEAQVVKLQLVGKSQLSPGEYRSHIYFRAVPNEKPLGEAAISNDSSVSIKLIPIYGISIPALIRVGETTAAVDITEGKYGIEADTLPFVIFSFVRTGNMSVYGNVSIEHIANGRTIKVADVKGVAVYTPNQRRKMWIPLKRNAGADFSSGKLRITYSEQSPKNTILAQSEISLD